MADQARSISSGEKAFFSGDVALHITEIALALNNAGQGAAVYRMKSSF
ncbi:oxidoreductase [Brucella melitensis]|nr:Gfo/Idh/MocA family oxidoreductase [Brucella melitensis M28]